MADLYKESLKHQKELKKHREKAARKEIKKELKANMGIIGRIPSNPILYKWGNVFIEKKNELKKAIGDTFSELGEKIGFGDEPEEVVTTTPEPEHTTENIGIKAKLGDKIKEIKQEKYQNKKNRIEELNNLKSERLYLKLKNVSSMALESGEADFIRNYEDYRQCQQIEVNKIEEIMLCLRIKGKESPLTAEESARLRNCELNYGPLPTEISEIEKYYDYLLIVEDIVQKPWEMLATDNEEIKEYQKNHPERKYNVTEIQNKKRRLELKTELLNTPNGPLVDAEKSAALKELSFVEMKTRYFDLKKISETELSDDDRKYIQVYEEYIEERQRLINEMNEKIKAVKSNYSVDEMDHLSYLQTKLKRIKRPWLTTSEEKKYIKNQEQKFGASDETSDFKIDTKKLQEAQKYLLLKNKILSNKNYDTKDEEFVSSYERGHLSIGDSGRHI